MSIIKVSPDDQETFSITTNPTRHYTSSSLGVTGSIYVYARRSKIEKNVAPSSAFVDATHDDADISNELENLQKYILNKKTIVNSANVENVLQAYMDKVDKQKISARKQKILEIIRFTPSYNFTSNTMRKLYVKDVLMRHYKTSYPTANWAYTNYNSLNFFTSSTVPTGSALLYPNVEAPASQFHEGYVSGTYTLSGAFSFDFYVNPRYKQDSIDKDFKAGTIFHLSSSYAVSLITGSSRDENGRSTGYRIQLQLSHSAGIVPSLTKPGSYPHNLTFLSDDNSLSSNRWHHVVIRWGTNLVNEGTGSFNIDGVDKGYFVVPSGTIAPLLSSEGEPSVLCVGNFYSGRNSGSDAQAYFFATDPAERDGLVELIVDGANVNEPTNYAFDHPLNAELHDLAIKRYYMTDLDIQVSSSVSPTSIDDSIAFYLPPFFTQTSSIRREVNGYGGILQTPFIAADDTTTTPYNVAMAYGVGGHFINIENYLKDFASNTHPRLHQMTASVLDTGTTPALSANDILYLNPYNIRRNLLIMPCDDGRFKPNYTLLTKEIEMQNAVEDDGNKNFSLVNLGNMLSTDALLFGTTFTDVEGTSAASAIEFVKDSIGFSPEDPTVSPGDAYKHFITSIKKQIALGNYAPGISSNAPLTIFQRTLDPSSDQVTFFDISNLYYGKRILPGSLVLTDSSVTGSGGAMRWTLRDDGMGNIYRADSFTEHAKWNSVGNIFYEEGIIVIKSPHLYFFGKNQFDISFRGEQNIHTLKLEIVAPRNQINSSSNPNFKELSPSGYITDPDPKYVYITGLNFHDKDLNVVAKTQLAQPIIKRHGDRIMFKVTLDMLQMAIKKSITKRKRRRRGKRYHSGIHVSPVAGECKYRSGWEEGYMRHLDSSAEVKTWSYESVVIPYVSNVRTGKLRKYYPDFDVTMQDGQRCLIEIKPSKKLSHRTVQKKIAAAQQWCSDHGVTYKILTEIELKVMGIILFNYFWCFYCLPYVDRIVLMAYHGYIPLVKQYLTNFAEPSVLEVGLDKGVSTIPLVNFMSRYHKKFFFLGIDILLQETLKLTLQNLDFFEEQSVNLCAGNSIEVLPEIAKQGVKFDVLLLDGDHNYHTVSRELSYLNELTHDKSLVIIDDYHGRWSEKDLWYSSRQEYQEIELATKPVETEKHGVKAAVDDFISNDKTWKMETLIPGGEPVVLTRKVELFYT